ncbi:MAG: hypothetical protein H6724_01920 [Sandaracinus sp.]|nr:hypothetical protein [Sandaracinus sp.]
MRALARGGLVTDAVVIGIVGSWVEGYDPRRLSTLLLEGVGHPSATHPVFQPTRLAELFGVDSDATGFHLDNDLGGPLYRMRREREMAPAYWRRLGEELEAAGTGGAFFAVMGRGFDRLFELPSDVRVVRSREEWEVPPPFDQPTLYWKRVEPQIRGPRPRRGKRGRMNGP